MDDKTQNLANTTFAEIDNSVDVDDRIEKTDLLTTLSNGFKEAMSILSSQPVGGGPAPGAIGASELVETDAGKEVGKSIISGTIKGGVDAANMAKDVADFTGKMINPMGNLMLQKKYKEEFGINLDNTDVVDMVMPIFGLTTNDFEMAMKEIEPDSTFGQMGSDLTAFLVASSLSPGGGLSAGKKAFLKGVFGDAAITPRTGNLATLAAELGVENEFVDFLNSYMENPFETSTFERLKARVKGATTDSVLIGTAFLAATKILASKIGQIGLGGAAVTASTTEEGEAGGFKTLATGLKQIFSELRPAPIDARAHKVPFQLLVESDGEKATKPVVQAFTAKNKKEVFTAIDETSLAHPDALKSSENWLMMEKEALGGEYLPIPPLKAIEYANSPEKMAEKLNNLTPEMKAGVDEGFSYVKEIRDIYSSGDAPTTMTADLFVWGILSRGAGPVQQEAAFIDIMQDARPLIQKVVDGTFSEADRIEWENTIKNSLPEGSPGKQVTMNVNAAGKLLFELSKIPEGSNSTVLETLHTMIADPNVLAKDIRREFMALTEGAGIDNKVVSFTLLVAGRDDVLVMDRIQGRHLWDDGRFEGKNIYDGFKKEGTTISEGLQGIFRGPRGILLTEMLEDGLRPNIQKTYELLGRPEDGTLGRWHWENWVIEGEQVVSHSTLSAISEGTPIGKSVVEGKFNTFSSGAKYIQTESGPVVEYPLSDGSSVFMTPTRQKEFESFIKNAKNGIVPKGFKVTENAERPWYERPEVNREALDQAARQFENAKPK